MTIEEAVRRNRWRIALVTTAALLNWWLLTTGVSWVLLWRNEDAEGASGSFQAATSIALGAIVAVSVLAYQLWSLRQRTLERIGAAAVQPGEVAVLSNLLEELGIATGVPAPTAALLHDLAPNALTVGTDPARTTIVVTTGLLTSLTRDELEAVLAAELWAVRRLDTAMQSVTVACTGSVISFHHFWREQAWNPRRWLPILVTWPTMLVAEVLRRAVHRNADFGADELAVATTRHPDGLRRALVKLREDARVVDALDATTAPLWFEPLPHDDEPRARELRRLVLSPSLDERLARLPGRS